MTTAWFVHLQIPEAATLSHLNGALQDLNAAQRFCRKFLAGFHGDAADPVTLEALSAALVIRYSRVFAGGKHSQSRIGEALLETMDESETALHQRVFSMRQKYVAHAASELEGNPVVAHVSDDPRQSHVAGSSVQNWHLLHLSAGLVEQLGTLIARLESNLSSRIETEREKLLAVVRTHSYEEIKKLPMPVLDPVWPTGT